MQGDSSISYHVSYSILGDSDAETILIYSGYKKDIPFVLPAGWLLYNKTGVYSWSLVIQV